MPQQVLDRPATETAPAKPTFPPLTARDRCDAATVAPKSDSLHQRGPCGAQAFVRVILVSGAELLFCGHCIDEQGRGEGATKNAAVRAIKDRRRVLEAAGATFHSNYANVNRKPTDPSNSQGF